MTVAIKDRSTTYRRILALLVEHGPKTKAQIAEALGIGETTARTAMNLAARDGRIYASDWIVPMRGHPAKLYSFGQGETPAMPKWNAHGRLPKCSEQREEETEIARAKALAEETLQRARSLVGREFNPFASLMMQV
jgi:predicted ArsR family transcriptional regulator